MSKNIFGIKNPGPMLTALMLFAITVLISPMALSAVQSFNITAKTLPNGQLAYALGSDAEAVIPGPSLFVRQGDTINIALTNNTSVEVGFSVPGLTDKGRGAANALPGQTQNYTFHANKSGTFAYHGNGKEMLGLFGALIVDPASGPIDRYVDDNGAIVPVSQTDIDKQFVLFMVGSTFWGTEISGDGMVQKTLWGTQILAQ